MNKKALIQTAMGREKADLGILNGKVIDVFNHKIKKANVFVKGDTVVYVGEDELEAETVIDAENMYISPGFTDAHLHIESSMITPNSYSALAAKLGTTTLVADPHEIANVCGEKGLEFMYSCPSTGDIRYMLPSCVPATDLDSSGAVLDSEACKKLWDTGMFMGLGEMMNYPGVINCSDDVMAKLDLCDKIDGHLPLGTGRGLQAYICGGIGNDHECSTAEEALEKVSLGLNILIREGTGAQNLQELIKAVTPYNSHHFAFCTDDKHIDGLVYEGTINHCISKAVSLGMDPITAFELGTINGAKIHGIKNVGAIAPGYRADIVIMSDLDPKAENIRAVYVKGKKFEENIPKVEPNQAVLSTVNLKNVDKADLIPVLSGEIPAIEVHRGSLITTPYYTDSTDGLLMCANIERHKATGRIGKAFIKGLSLKNAAVAQTIGHDSHNITVLGDNGSDMALAVNSLGKDGGICLVSQGKVLAFVKLEVAGLMTARPWQELLRDTEKLEKTLASLSPDDGGFLLMILSFLSLLVIPEIKVSDRGVFDVNRWRFLGEWDSKTIRIR